MIRWRRIIGLCAALFCLVTGAAEARQSANARALLTTCDRDAHEATFQGQLSQVRKGLKMQLRFTLQVSTPDAPRYRKVAADGFGAWITAPSTARKYTYDKTVQGLLVPASYRVAIDFRWKSKAGRTIRTERAISPVCKQPDARPDLVVRNVRIEDGSFVGVIFNRGREAAGPFAVEFLVDGTSVGRVEVTGLASQTPITVLTPAKACAPGTPLEVVADARAQVDEADEENNSLDAPC